MAHQYRVMTTDEQNDIVVQFLGAQERDLYCHELNKARYESMLAALDPSDPFHKRVVGLLADTNTRIAEVQKIIDHTLPQLPTPLEVEQAIERTRTR